MINEIERKFLVAGEFKSLSVGKFEIQQGYLSSDPERTVRIRIAGKKGYITVKGKSNEKGMTRLEWEKEILFDEAKALLELCEPGVVQKTRYIVDMDDFVFEVDEFHGENQGLIIAEVEIQSEEDEVDLPDWIGEEITGNPKYYNSYISNHPFSEW